MVEIDLNISDYKSYVAATKNFENNRAYETISVNLQNILFLKKLTCYEVNYFINFEEPGVVMKVYGNMLKSTMATKSAWALLAEDMACIIKYFLGKFKQIKTCTTNWLPFLNSLLIYTYMLCQRAESKTDVIVGVLAKNLLELISELEVEQVMRVLITFNFISSRSSRKLRLQLKSDLDPYLSKLSTLVCTCNFYPVQLLCMETLNRWLVNRNIREARVEATKTWFAGYLDAAQLFQECPFKDFLGDTRWFLNQLNEKEDVVVSVLCRRLSIGNAAVITGEESTVSYIDINTSQRSVTVVLTPSVVRRLNVASDRPCTHEVVLITHDIVSKALLHRHTVHLLVSLQCASPPMLLYDNSTDQFNSGEVLIQVSSQTELQRLDTAMRAVFRECYQNNLDSSDTLKSVHPSPNVIPNTAATKGFSSSEEDKNICKSRPSRKRKNVGYKIAPRFVVGSPSSVSTTSLAQLRSRLAQLPSFTFPKEAFGVSVSPKLSSLSEITEPGSSQNTTVRSTASRKPNVGVQYTPRHKAYITHSDTEGGKMNKSRLYTQHEAPGDETDTSVLRVAYDRSTENEIDLVELLAKEAFVAEADHFVNGTYKGDKKTNTDDNTSEATDNTAFEPVAKNVSNRLIKPKKCTVVSNSSDESNTDAIQDTPAAFVNVRRKKNIVESPGVDFDFFACSVGGENNITTIDPALARKVNASSDSENEDGNALQDDNDVIYCLNSMIDKVCQDLDICAKEDTVMRPQENALKNNVYAPIDENSDKISTENQEKQKTDNNTQKKTKKGKIPKIVIKKLETTSKIMGNKKYQKPTDKIQVVPIQNERQNTPEEELFKKKIALSGKKVIPQKKKQPVTKQKKTSSNKLKFKTVANTKKEDKTAPEEVNEVSDQEPKTNPKTNISPAKSENQSPKTAPKNNNNKVTPKSNNENYDSDDALLITRRKRKLYSPKDDEIEQAVINYEDDIEILSDAKHTNKESRKSYYQDKTPQKRQRRKSKAEQSAETRRESPRTLKNNAIFDSLKQTETVAKIFTVVKKCSKQDIAVYNYSSESEDEDFKQLKLNVKSRISSSTLCSTDSLISRRGRAVRNVDYTEKSSSEDFRKKPARKSYKCKSKTPKRDLPLIDERMREAQPEELNTSFVKKQNNSVEKKMSPPKITHEMEVLEANNIENTDLNIGNDKAENKRVINDDFIELIDLDVNKPQIKQDEIHKEVKIKSENVNSRPQKNKTKNQKRQATPKVEEKVTDKKEKSESPLPDLIMEPIPNKDADLEDTMLSNNFVEKFKKLLECSVQTDTTQNLLSDMQCNESVYSPPQSRNNITHDYEDIVHIPSDNPDINPDNINTIEKQNDNASIIKEIHNDNVNIPDFTFNADCIPKNKNTFENNDIDIITINERGVNNKPNSRRGKANLIRNVKKEINETSANVTKITHIGTNMSISSTSDDQDEKSISTHGNSPITAHGEELESPPNVDMLKEVFTPRNVQVELFDKKLQHFFHELNFEVQNSNSTLNEIDSAIDRRTRKSERNRFNAKSVPNSQEKSLIIDSTFDKTESTLKSTISKTKRSSISPINLDFLSQKLNGNEFGCQSTDESNVISSTRSASKRRFEEMDGSIYECDSSLPKLRRFTAREKPVQSPSPPKIKRDTAREKPVESPSPPKTGRFTAREKTDEYPKVVLSSTVPLKKVDDWLTRSSSSVASSADTFKDCVLNIMEKVDTVLSETLQQSNEAIINLLIKDREELDKVQKKIKDVNDTLERVHTELMKHINIVMEDMIDTYKMESARRAKEMLRKECAKKQAVAMLIREDVQAYMDEMKRKN